MMSADEIKHIAGESAKAAVKEFLIAMGVDASKPEALLELQADFRHVRQSRIAVAAMRSKVMLSLVGLFVTGVVAAVWQAVTGIHH